MIGPREQPSDADTRDDLFFHYQRDTARRVQLTFSCQAIIRFLNKRSVRPVPYARNYATGDLFGKICFQATVEQGTGGRVLREEDRGTAGPGGTENGHWEWHGTGDRGGHLGSIRISIFSPGDLGNFVIRHRPKAWNPVCSFAHTDRENGAEDLKEMTFITTT